MNTRKRQLTSDWKYILTQGINTQELQLKALAYFLSDLGYSIGVRNNGDQLHVFKHKGETADSNPNLKCMSFDVAVSLFNGNTTMKTNGNIYEAYDFTFNRSDFKKAFDNRILDAVYLQRDKGKIKVQKHWVKFNKSESIGMEYQ